MSPAAPWPRAWCADVGSQCSSSRSGSATRSSPRLSAARGCTRAPNSCTPSRTMTTSCSATFRPCCGTRAWPPTTTTLSVAPAVSTPCLTSTCSCFWRGSRHSFVPEPTAGSVQRATLPTRTAPPPWTSGAATSGSSLMASPLRTTSCAMKARRGASSPISATFTATSPSPRTAACWSACRVCEPTSRVSTQGRRTARRCRR
mmetsp:Transcript_29616/g.85046  ORF Transcript_29616/g.85046 Transcript_29616/m.85046 type:complete len:202 (-) Transcript_29616:1002-1607(-)